MATTLSSELEGLDGTWAVHLTMLITVEENERVVGAWKSIQEGSLV